MFVYSKPTTDLLVEVPVVSHLAYGRRKVKECHYVRQTVGGDYPGAKEEYFYALVISVYIKLLFTHE